jgi:hypothetical protein
MALEYVSAVRPLLRGVKASVLVQVAPTSAHGCVVALFAGAGLSAFAMYDRVYATLDLASEELLNVYGRRHEAAQEVVGGWWRGVSRCAGDGAVCEETTSDSFSSAG